MFNTNSSTQLAGNLFFVIAYIILGFVMSKTVIANSSIINIKNQLENECVQENEVCSCVKGIIVPLVDGEYNNYIQHLYFKKIPELNKQYPELANQLKTKVDEKKNNFESNLIRELRLLKSCSNDFSTTSCQPCENIKQHRTNWISVKKEIDHCIVAIKNINVKDSESSFCKIFNIYENNNYSKEQKTAVAQEPLEAQETAVSQEPLEKQKTVASQEPLEAQETAISQELLEAQETAVVQEPLEKQETAVVQEPLEKQETAVVQESTKTTNCNAGQKLKLPASLEKLLSQNFIYIKAGDYTDKLNEYVDAGESNKDYLDGYKRAINLDKVEVSKSFAIQVNETSISDFMKAHKSDKQFSSFTECKDISWLDDSQFPAACLSHKNISTYIDILNKVDPSTSIHFSLPSVEQWLVAAILFGEQNPYIGKKETPLRVTERSDQVENLLGNLAEISATLSHKEGLYSYGKSFKLENHKDIFNGIKVSISSVNRNKSTEAFGFRLVAISKDNIECIDRAE